VQNAIEAWNTNILVTEFTPPAKRLYDKTKNFRSLDNKTGLRLYVRFDLSKFLPNKIGFFKKLPWVLKSFDLMANSLFDLRFHFYKNKLQDVTLEYINHIDHEVETFIKNKQESQIFRRNATDLNWIIKNPWVLKQTLWFFNYG